MVSSKIKTIVIVSVLLLFVGFVAVGCKPKPRAAAWVNTGSMPGNTFTQYVKHDIKKGTSEVIHLSDSSNSDTNFGPRDVSFEFQELR